MENNKGPQRKLMVANASRGLMAKAKSERERTASYSLPAPQVLDSGEVAITKLQATIAQYAHALHDRAMEGSTSSHDMKLTSMLASSAARLAQEQREARAEVSLALNSDEDIVNLLISSIKQLPNGMDLLVAAMSELMGPEPTQAPGPEGADGEPA